MIQTNHRHITNCVSLNKEFNKFIKLLTIPYTQLQKFYEENLRNPNKDKFFVIIEKQEVI